MTHIYRTIAKVVPLKLRKKMKSFLPYSNIKIDSDNFIGFVTLTSILIGLIAGFFLGSFLKKPFWIFFVSFTSVTNIIIYLWLILLVDKKAKLIEEALPDALQLMSSNLKAGMTPDKALLLSSRPEFGPLKEEIDLVGKKITLGKNIGDALMEMAKRVRSKRLLRAIELINSGLNSGGSLATLMEATSNNLREQFLVDKRIKASITMYVIFIFSAAALIAPVLYGLSSFLVEVVGKSFAEVQIPTTAASSLPIQAGQSAITPEFLLMFIIVFLVVNSFMASMLLGLISKGNQREGFRYFIPMIMLAIPIFLIVRVIISSALSGLFTI